MLSVASEPMTPVGCPPAPLPVHNKCSMYQRHEADIASLTTAEQDADAANVTAARKAADAAGLLNRRVWIDQGDFDRLLPVGRSADLVVVADDTLEVAHHQRVGVRP